MKKDVHNIMPKDDSLHEMFLLKYLFSEVKQYGEIIFNNSSLKLVCALRYEDNYTNFYGACYTSQVFYIEHNNQKLVKFSILNSFDRPHSSKVEFYLEFENDTHHEIFHDNDFSITSENYSRILKVDRDTYSYIQKINYYVEYVLFRNCMNGVMKRMFVDYGFNVDKRIYNSIPHEIVNPTKENLDILKACEEVKNVNEITIRNGVNSKVI